MNKLADVAHNAFARTIYPVHTSFDGDTIFTMSTNQVPCGVDELGVLMVYVMERAILNAVKNAKKIGDIPGYGDL